MGVFIVCTLILFYGLFMYGANKHGQGALVFFFFLTGGFHFLKEGWCPIKYLDFAIVYLIVIALINVMKGNITFFKPQIKIYKIALAIGLYITLEFVRTIVFKEEFFYFALANYRTYIPILSFWLVQELKSQEIKLLLKQITVITVLSTIMFDIQPLLNIRILQHASIDGINSVNSLARYRNIPYLAYFFILLYSIRLDFKKFKTYALVLIFITAIVLTQHRGVMLSYILCIAIYLIISKKGVKFIQIGTMGIIIYFLMGNAIVDRFNKDNYNKYNTWNDIKNVVNLDYQRAIDNEYTNEGGTLSFRVLMLIERIKYMSSNPKKLIFGIGTRHEDSPNTKKQFNFILGSHNRKTNTYGQISTGDLVWMSPFMRFGLMGIILLLCFSFFIIKFLYKERKNSDIAMTTFLFYLFLIFISFKNDHLYGNLQLYFIYLLIEYIRCFHYKLGNAKQI